ncbi:hypothetical protein CES85_2786 (plasmid) [Ochrobactrum quorumnocens]|uniref:Uncharacterized protein n=1 Tax=Ochrobactrum quorumnocens TaxID=271865 RepID=A0A248UPA9_9HYPH|nr:hypothetical protein CES85_2786 [[Ochrobactrum] quorumnocens]
MFWVIRLFCPGVEQHVALAKPSTSTFGCSETFFRRSVIDLYRWRTNAVYSPACFTRPIAFPSSSTENAVDSKGFRLSLTGPSRNITGTPAALSSSTVSSQPACHWLITNRSGDALRILSTEVSVGCSAPTVAMLSISGNSLWKEAYTPLSIRCGFAHPAILETGSFSIKANERRSRLSLKTIRFAGAFSRTSRPAASSSTICAVASRTGPIRSAKRKIGRIPMISNNRVRIARTWVPNCSTNGISGWR